MLHPDGHDAAWIILHPQTLSILIKSQILHLSEDTLFYMDILYLFWNRENFRIEHLPFIVRAKGPISPPQEDHCHRTLWYA